MKWRFVDRDADSQLIADWAGHRKLAFSKDELPDIGFMIYTDQKPILCAFLITTNAKFAYIEMLISNPETKDDERQEAVTILSEIARGVAKDLGYNRIIVTSFIDQLINKFKNSGFNFLENKCSLGVREI